MSGAADLRALVQGTKEEIDQDVRAVQLALFRSVILGTPVDEGRARGNWQTSVGTPASGTIERLDPSGAGAIAEVLANMGGAGSVTWLSNNLPYIEVLELGGYPNPPKHGTWVSGKLGRKRKDGSRKRAAGHFEVRSAGGFSKQAPAGMVRINVARIADIIRKVRAGAPT